MNKCRRDETTKLTIFHAMLIAVASDVTLSYRQTPSSTYFLFSFLSIQPLLFLAVIIARPDIFFSMQHVDFQFLTFITFRYTTNFDFREKMSACL